ncbi:MAG: hypothetical protein CME98_24265 [Hyphomonas sp.]|nr:hypothetical protein [Hyphomonas sp.]
MILIIGELIIKVLVILNIYILIVMPQKLQVHQLGIILHQLLLYLVLEMQEQLMRLVLII